MRVLIFLILIIFVHAHGPLHESDFPKFRSAIALFEWNRWFSFIDENEAVVIIDPMYFPKRVWDEVLDICKDMRYECKIDTPEDKLNRKYIDCKEVEPSLTDPPFQSYADKSPLYKSCWCGIWECIIDAAYDLKWFGGPRELYQGKTTAVIKKK